MPSEQPPTRTDRRHDSTTAVVSIAFSYQHVAYTVDLDPTDAAEFDAAMAPYIAAARRVGGSRRQGLNPRP